MNEQQRSFERSDGRVNGRTDVLVFDDAASTLKRKRSSAAGAGKFKIIDESIRATRTEKSVDAAWEGGALRRLAECIGDEPHTVLQGLLSLATELCGGGVGASTAGISLLERADDGTEMFRWVALAGRLVDHIGGTTPRNFSPCGMCLDANAPLHLARPDLKFTYFLEAGTEFTEGLILPFSTGSNADPMGTLWVISHPPVRHRFSPEDMRVMESLTRFAASAYRLSKARDEAERKTRGHQHLLATVSHDLRTPLQTISGYVDILSLGIQGALNEAQKESLVRIRKTEKFLAEVLDGLMECSRQDSTPPELELSPIPLGQTLSSAYSLIEPQMRAKSIAYEYEPCDSSVVVRTDCSKMEQILVNLLANATKFTQANGRVTLSAHIAGDNAVIAVADTGRGIPPDKLDRIFEPFVRVDAAASEEAQKGVGLGLAISRSLARRMGADITVRSEYGRGSVFSLSVPLA
ncbi:MAG: GAF domain-containing sensor histidine kinase [Gemmatimonadaceae bacterium]